jgi:hypothetical protein
VTVSAEHDWLGAAIATCGGCALVVGALLPWMSLFAGLQRYPGVAGLNGRLLLIGGALATLGGVALATRPRPRLRGALGVLGLVLAAFASWVLRGLQMTLHALAHHPFLLARPGSGLFVALAGALLLTLLIAPMLRRPRRALARSGDE